MPLSPSPPPEYRTVVGDGPQNPGGSGGSGPGSNRNTRPTRHPRDPRDPWVPRRPRDPDSPPSYEEAMSMPRVDGIPLPPPPSTTGFPPPYEEPCQPTVLEMELIAGPAGSSRSSTNSAADSLLLSDEFYSGVRWTIVLFVVAVIGLIFIAVVLGVVISRGKGS
ncbi:protein UL42 [Aotine betaherpesvirus 1]|uniref:Protein UL42 n=1 Tax=Aotine betaherpesvirus 1 TaxID=50290 RepID=G8XUB7_9BETA|nr:protein UL42 [Aotine betaherpesvirus 1]AEV80747.1 protein UL42 [Aotine betaherpesvirus 1]